MATCCSAPSANLAIRQAAHQARRWNQWVRAWVSEAHCQTLAKLQCSSKIRGEAWKQRGGEAIVSHNSFLQCSPHTSLVQGQTAAPKTDPQPKQPNHYSQWEVRGCTPPWYLFVHGFACSTNTLCCVSFQMHFKHRKKISYFLRVELHLPKN